MPTSTLQKIWSKKVNVWTQVRENWKITVILTILVSGEKLASLSIYKAKEVKDTEIKLQ